MTDNEVVALILSGEKEKFGKIIDRYQSKLYGYLRNFTNQEPEVVEDLVSEVLINCYVNLHGFDNKQSFSSWLFRIAHNRAIDFFRKNKKIITVINGDDWMENIASEEKLIEDMEIVTENKKELIEALARLELKYREVIDLYFFESKSYEEISDILHIPVSNVGVLLYRAKKILKKIISK